MGASSKLRVGARPRLLFVTGTAANVHGGSGTYVGISVLRTAVEALGCEVEMVAPAGSSAAAWRRLWFNRRLRSLELGGFDAWVGFDLDGVFIRRAGVRNVASIKGVLAEERRFEHGWPALSLGVQAWFERRRAQQADRVLVTSQYAAGAIERHYRVPRERIRVVPELIDLARWRERLAAAALAPHDEPRILCVAHLYPRKDLATLLLARTRLRHPAALRVVGHGPELRRLQDLSRRLALRERSKVPVEFLGHLPLQQLAVEYRSADIFCLPSRQEGFGIVFLEAMAAGLPVVAARAAAVPEVVGEGESGLLAEAGNVADFAACLDRLLADPVERQRLGNNGRQRVIRYDAPRIARAFLDAVLDVR